MIFLFSAAPLFPTLSLHDALPISVAVLLIVPAPLAVAVTVNVALPPLRWEAHTPVLPPLTNVQRRPAEAAKVQVTELSCAGKTSLTVAPTTALGPALLATIV